MDSLIEELRRRGGSLGDWDAGLSRDLRGADMCWQDGRVLGPAVVEHAKRMMATGGYLEYECYDEDGNPQGRAVICLLEWPDGDAGVVSARHVAASDDYYAWYAEQELGVDRAAYHLCTGPRAGCRYVQPRASRREVVHLERWRLVNPLVMAEIGYCAEAAVGEMRDWVQAFVPKLAPVEAVAESGLDRALAEAARGGSAEVEAIPKEVESAPRGEPSKASVGALLRGRAELRREQTEGKRHRSRDRKRRRRSRSRQREKRSRSRRGSRERSSSRSSKSSQGFQQPLARGGDELWRLSQKHPGKLLKSGMQELSRYLAERSEEGSSEDQWADRKVMAYVTQVILSLHPPSSIGVRNHRELITLGTSLDHLLQGRLPELGDLLMQRLKALDTSIGDQGWATARHQELIPPLAATLTSTGERERSAKVEMRHLKMREMVSKSKGHNK